MADDLKPPTQWALYRLAYHFGRFVLVLAIAYFGSNWIAFRQLTLLKPSDMSEMARVKVVPIAQAAAKYYHDHGEFPHERQEMVSQYLPEPDNDDRWHHNCFFRDNQLRYDAYGIQQIVYRFEEPGRGWFTEGPYTEGPIPNVPQVELPTPKRP